ncbi:hypothetical protein AB0M83_09040 [Amycolatopsis sp. NPDC051106]|uniref:hypothetical protein n=1 Tax=unclassified Amycolatopsis TaxID=2618356 RepID=UPI00344212A0
MTDLLQPVWCITGVDQLESGHSLPAVAVNLVAEVGRLRDQGQFPEHVSMGVEVDSGLRLLDVRVHGLSPARDPDRMETMSAIRTVFELASHANVVDISGTVAPLFTIRIVAVDFDSIPYAGLLGAGMGDIHPAVQHHW